MKVRIYSGLSLDAAQVRSVLPRASFAGPIKRGDIARDLDVGTHVIGIVDGVFFSQLAVSASEVLDALRCGVRVLGASSMGALRAAELAPYGMIGIGAIYEHIRATRYFADDLLGQVFVEERPSLHSFPAIDLELGLARLVAARRLSSAVASELVGRYRGMHFSERDLPSLLRVIEAERPFGRATPRLIALVRELPSTKTADGLALLRAVEKLRDLDRL